jgi:hypothetical protein
VPTTPMTTQKKTTAAKSRSRPKAADWKTTIFLVGDEPQAQVENWTNDPGYSLSCPSRWLSVCHLII